MQWKEFPNSGKTNTNSPLFFFRLTESKPVFRRLKSKPSAEAHKYKSLHSALEEKATEADINFMISARPECKSLIRHFNNYYASIIYYVRSSTLPLTIL